MSKRFAWLLGMVVLVSIGLLVACGSNYHASSDGLVLVGSQGSAVLQTFSFDLASGHAAGISNPAVTSGTPTSIVVDPAGTYAYVIVDQSSIAAFKINSNGTTTAVGSPVSFRQGSVRIQGTPTTTPPENVSVVPNTIKMDPAGKFLFVSDRKSVV